MSKIRINELARELEVKSHLVLEYLVELGVGDKRSHSSALEDDLAEKVRQHFRAPQESQPAPTLTRPQPEPKPIVAPAPAGAKPHEAAQPVEGVTRPAGQPTVARPPVALGPPSASLRSEAPPAPRTLEQIKEDARRAMLGAKAIAEKPAAPATPAVGPSAAPAPAVRRPAAPAVPGALVAPAAKPGTPVATASAGPAVAPTARLRELTPASTAATPAGHVKAAAGAA